MQINTFNKHLLESPSRPKMVSFNEKCVQSSPSFCAHEIQYSRFRHLIVKKRGGTTLAINFPNANKLKEGLKKLDEYFVAEKFIFAKQKNRILLDFIDRTGALKKEKVYGVPGLAPRTTVYDLGNNRVLKISSQNPFEYRQYNPAFDVLFLSEIKKYRDHYIYIQRKAPNSKTTVEDTKNIIAKMKKVGYIPSRDFDVHRTDQVGRYKEKPYLIDTLCAIPRPKFWTRVAGQFGGGSNKVDTSVIPFNNQIGFVNERPPTDIKMGKSILIVLKSLFYR